MSDEIKEILKYYKNDAEKFEYLMKDYTEEQLKTTFSRSYQRYRNHKLLLDCITNLQERCAYLERSNDRREDTILGLRQEVDDVEQQRDKALNEIQYIIDYGFDYDGFNTVESLKGLIDMLVDYARNAKKILKESDDNE